MRFADRLYKYFSTPDLFTNRILTIRLFHWCLNSYRRFRKFISMSDRNHCTSHFGSVCHQQLAHQLAWVFYQLHKHIRLRLLFLGNPFLKFVFCDCDTTDFQTDRLKILPIRMLNALCCPFLKFTSLAPLVAIFVIFGLYFMLQSPEEIVVLPMVEP